MTVPESEPSCPRLRKALPVVAAAAAAAAIVRALLAWRVIGNDGDMLSIALYALASFLFAGATFSSERRAKKTLEVVLMTSAAAMFAANVFLSSWSAMRPAIEVHNLGKAAATIRLEGHDRVELPAGGRWSSRHSLGDSLSVMHGVLDGAPSKSFVLDRWGELLRIDVNADDPAKIEFGYADAK